MTDELRRAIRKLVITLEERPDVFFGHLPDWEDGLNAAEINRLAGQEIIVVTGNRRCPDSITFRHPADRIEDRTWLIRGETGWSTDRHHATWADGRSNKLKATVAILQAWAEGAPKPAAAPKKKRRKKAEVELIVRAAITFKLQNPDATEAECAKAVGLESSSTLNGNKEWTNWKSMIDENAGSQSGLRRVRSQFDRRTGEWLLQDPDT